jgi:hypothetical protein
LHAIEGRFDLGVGYDRSLHQGVQFRIVQRLPPAADALRLRRINAARLNASHGYTRGRQGSFFWVRSFTSAKVRTQNHAIADQLDSQTANRLFDRAGAVVRCRPQISEFDKPRDHRKRRNGSLETDRTATR